MASRKHIFTKKYTWHLAKDVAIKCAMIAGLAALVLGAHALDIWNVFYTKVLIVLMSFVKTIYFIEQGLRLLIRAVFRNLLYHEFLFVIAVIIALYVGSFAIDFYLLYHVHPAAYTGIPQGLSAFYLAFEFAYFSILNFTTFGYSEVIPRTMPGKLLVVNEIVVSFLTIIFVLSDFVSLKESIMEQNKHRPRPPA